MVCGLCEQTYVRRDKESHDEECSGKLEASPNDGCGTICLSKDLAAHRTTCKFERIRCRLHEEGLCGEHCPKTLLWRDWCTYLYSPITVDALMENAVRKSKRRRVVKKSKKPTNDHKDDEEEDDDDDSIEFEVEDNEDMMQDYH